MAILENINSPEDVKKLNSAELYTLSSEIRDFLINSVSKTGGHLAANLGAVEMTIAVHRVFDTKKDRLVFDVGHQSYVHKILTGRKDKFDTLRQFGGISGFPKPCESIHDAFIAGHASNSVSVALGMARARTIANENYSVVAVIGDGALTGGTAYEGLSDAGDSGEPMIVILNDNGMSIASNVGGIAKYLAHERLKPGYMRFKRNYRRIMGKTGLGRAVYKVLHGIKDAVKEAILHCSMFEDMGFEYLGPVDGHDIQMMTYVLELAKGMQKPVLIHAITKKGKGYSFAEQSPNKYHGVGPFDPRRGVEENTSPDFSSVFGDKLLELAGKDRRICAVTAAMGESTGLKNFFREFPDRVFDVGIAEGHAVSMCAGMAKQGLVPVFAVYSTFLQRAYDMLLHDVAISGLHVVLAVDRAGLVGADGETHQGSFDINYLTGIPNMTVYSPSNFTELRMMLEKAVLFEKGPVAVRYPRGGQGEYIDACTGDGGVVREGRDFTVVTYGTDINTAVNSAKRLEKEGISVEIVKLGKVWPVDFGLIEESVGKTGRLLVLEECASSGSLGEKIAAHFAGRGGLKSLVLKNLGGGFVQHGDIESLRGMLGIDEAGVCGAIKEEVEK